jgi:hypothetical protein
LFDWQDLTASELKSLMRITNNDDMPLYMVFSHDLNFHSFLLISRGKAVRYSQKSSGKWENDLLWRAEIDFEKYVRTSCELG